MKSETLPSERSFGLLFTLIFVTLAGHRVYVGASGALTILFGLLALLLLIVSIRIPALLRPLNKAWFALGLLLGRVVSPIVLGIIFFGLITPTAVIARFLGRDELRLKKRMSETYWINRDPAGPTPDSFKNQF